MLVTGFDIPLHMIEEFENYLATGNSYVAPVVGEFAG
jgi:hypothetical protein